MFLYKKKLLFILTILTLPLGIFAQPVNQLKTEASKANLVNQPKSKSNFANFDFNCTDLRIIANNLALGVTNPLDYENHIDPFDPKLIQLIPNPQIREATGVISIIKKLDPSIDLRNFDIIQAIDSLTKFIAKISVPKNNKNILDIKVLKEIVKKLINCLDFTQIDTIIVDDELFRNILTNFYNLDLVINRIENLNLQRHDIQNLLFHILVQILHYAHSHNEHNNTALLNHFLNNHYLYDILEPSNPEAKAVILNIFEEIDDFIEDATDNINLIKENNPANYQESDEYKIEKNNLDVLFNLREALKQEITKQKF